jgi:RluA family pseudouridine synthase
MQPLHLDASLLVLDKPAGLPVTPDGWVKGAPHLAALAESEYGKLWIVHRLDKITSGVLVLARTPEAHRILSVQFEKHETTKVYHGIANGSPAWTERTARHPLRGDVGHKHRTVVDHRRGKPSTTQFIVRQRFRANALLEARPITGRTHQVRVHAAALQFPLLGDSLYGATATGLIDRPALHALSLTLAHPVSRVPMTFTAPYPEDFQRALASLEASGP